MAAVKYAPPAIPPMKKYQTIRGCHSGALSTAVPLAAPRPEAHHRAGADDQRGADGEQRVSEHVPLGEERLLGQVVGRRFVEEEEEGIEAAEGPVLVRPVELGPREAHLLEGPQPLLGL